MRQKDFFFLRVAELVDMGAVIAAGLPDADGDVIPPAVSFGGYRVRKVRGRLHANLTTEALLFNPQTKSFLTFYNTGCCYDAIDFVPDYLVGVVGGSSQLDVFGRCASSGYWEPLTFGASYSSGNTNVATVNRFSGDVSFVGPGQTNLFTNVNYCASSGLGSPCFECFVVDESCSFAFASDSTPVTVNAPDIFVSLSPASVTPEGQTMVTVFTLPAVSGLSVSLTIEEVPNTGGHISHPQRTSLQQGSFAASSGTTDANGQFTTTYTASKFGGDEKITATAGEGTNNTLLFVRISSPLSFLGPGTNYTLIGTTNSHPGNHYGTATANSRLVAIADDYAAMYPGSKLNYNDQSLHTGGLFDIGPTEEHPEYQLWEPPHHEHRLGKNCDVDDNNVPPERWGMLEQIFRNNGDLDPTHEIDKNHWHLVL